MNREIKFRGRNLCGQWYYGNLIVREVDSPVSETNQAYRCVYIGDIEDGSEEEVEEDTIGQFTGLCDKNGVEIYEGDIVSFYKSDTKCINPGCDVFNLIYESYIQKVEDEVSCENGMFSCDVSPLAYCGISDLDDIRDYLGVLEEDGWSDVNGNIIDEHILGIEVICNKFDNPDLIKSL